MLRKALISVFLIAFACMVGSGCAKSTCEKICDYLERCEGASCTSGDIDDCVEDYKDEESDCRKATRDWADCLDDSTCADVGLGGCQSEIVEAANECG